MNGSGCPPGDAGISRCNTQAIETFEWKPITFGSGRRKHLVVNGRKRKEEKKTKTKPFHSNEWHGVYALRLIKQTKQTKLKTTTAVLFSISSTLHYGKVSTTSVKANGINRKQRLINVAAYSYCTSRQNVSFQRLTSCTNLPSKSSSSSLRPRQFSK